MKRRHLVVIVSAFTLLTMVFVMVVTIGVGVGTDAGREQIRALIQQQVGARIHGKLHIGKITGGLLTGFTLDTFAIRDLEDSLLVSTGPISLQYDPRDLMDRRLLLRNVVVAHPVVRLRQYAKGDWNFQRVFRSGGSPSPNIPGRSFGDFVVLDSVRVRDGQFILTRPWEPDDSLRGAKRDSAVRVNLASKHREIRRSTDGLVHTYRWSGASALLPRVRLADPDSDALGQKFTIASLRVEEQEPPFSFRSARGTVRKLGDSVFVEISHFELPASTGNATGKIWWGSHLPIRLDLRIRGDSVSMSDVAWIYPTLPGTGVGSTDLRISNDPQNLHAFRYALTNLDVRSTRSRLLGAMTFVVGGPVLAVRDVDLRAAPVNFDLLRTLAGGPFPVDWQGDLTGHARGPGGLLTHFVVNESDIMFRDANVRGAVSRFSGSGELDILRPAFTNFHGFAVNAASLDLRSIQHLFPEFPRLGGTIAGTATLDSSWLDVRFSRANVRHRNGPGEPTRVTGAGRVTWGDEFMTYDVAVNARPLSLTMLSRAYPLGLQGLVNGPVQAKGTTDDLQLSMQLEGPAGAITFSGRVDADPLSVAAHGSGHVESLDLAQLLDRASAPRAVVTGTYQLDVRGDTNDLGTLTGSASALVERADVQGTRVFPSRLSARFAQGRIFVDTLRLESAAGVVTASGALGLTRAVSDSLRYEVIVDSLGGLRQYVTRLMSSGTPAAGAAPDSLAGRLVLTGTARGSLRAPELTGQLSGTDVFIRREAGRDIAGSFALSDAFTRPRGTVSLRLGDVTVGGITMDTLGVSLRFEDRGGGFAVSALSANGVTLDARGDLNLSDSVTTAVLRSVALATDSSRWSLARPAHIRIPAQGLMIDSLALTNGEGGRILLSAIVPAHGQARLLFRGDSVSLHDVGRVAQLREPLNGWADIEAQGAGTGDAPIVEMQATLSDVRFGGMHLAEVVASGDFRERRARVKVDISDAGRVAIIARGSLPLELRYFGARLPDDTISATIRTDSASLAIVEALLPGLRDATGQLVANIDVSGTWQHPDVAGALQVANGEVTIDSLGIRMRGVNADVALFGHRDSLAVRRLVGWSGTGPEDSISLRGYVAYRDMADPYVNLRLDARTFHLLEKRTLARLDVSTEPSGLRLRGQLRGATLTGGLVVDRGTIYLPDPALARKQVMDIDMTRLDTASARERVSRATSSLFGSILMDGVRITLGDEVWLRSREANIKLVGALNVQRSTVARRGPALGQAGADTLALVLDGELRAERGTYTLGLNVVQREFQVEGGTITFFPTPELAPELDISALHTVRTETGADLRIRVRITGPLYPNPIVSLESAESFALSQSDLVSYLIFGQPNFELQADRKGYVQLAAQTLFPSAQTFAASQLRGILGSWADVVQFRPGTADPSTLTGTGSEATKGLSEILSTSRLGLEKQLTDNLFVSVGTGICQFHGSQNGTNQWLDVYNGLSGKIEFRLSPDASIKAGKEPSAMSCDQRSSGRLVPTPTQWGFSLFKTWHF